MSPSDGVAGEQTSRRNQRCPCGSGRRFKNCHGGSDHETLRGPSFQQGPDRDQGQPLYCAADGWYHKLQAGRYHFASSETVAKGVLSANTLRLMLAAEEYAMPEEHITACAEEHGLERDELWRLVEPLRANGLLQGSSEVVRRLSQPAAAARGAQPEYAGICFRTCETPDHAERQLESLVRRKRRWGNSDPVFVLDDSKSPGSQCAHEQLVDDFRAELDVRYLGPRWQQKFVKSLNDALPQHCETIERMLLPQSGVFFSGGRMTNLASLLFAGRCFTFFDDDRLLDEARRHPLAGDPVIALGRRGEMVHQGFADESEARSAGEPIDDDPLSVHVDTIGLTIGEFIAAHPEYRLTDRSLAGVSARNAPLFQADSRIVSSGNGIFGTPRKRDARFLFMQTYRDVPPPWADWGADEDGGYRHLLEGGFGWESAARLNIVGCTASTPSAVDASLLIPPTISWGRSEDTLQSMMMQLLHPNTVHVEYPWALAHFRNVKPWWEETFRIPPEMGLGQLIISVCGREEGLDQCEVEEKLELVAARLLHLARSSNHQFEAEIRRAWLHSGLSSLRGMRRALEQLDNDRGRALKDYEAICANDLQYYSHGKLPPLVDTHGDDLDAQICSMKVDLQHYAKALVAWPEIWRWCLDNTDLVAS